VTGSYASSSFTDGTKPAWLNEVCHVQPHPDKVGLKVNSTPLPASVMHTCRVVHLVSITSLVTPGRGPPVWLPDRIPKHTHTPRRSAFQRAVNSKSTQ